MCAHFSVPVYCPLNSAGVVSSSVSFPYFLLHWDILAKNVTSRVSGPFIDMGFGFFNLFNDDIIFTIGEYVFFKKNILSLPQENAVTVCDL